MVRLSWLLLASLLLSLPAAAADVAAGLTEALIIGTGRVVDRLGKPGGFIDDPRVRIPLPAGIDKLRPALAMAGLSGMVDDLDQRMNHAAEQAVPVAKDLIVDAIRAMSFKDAMGILKGPEDSATRYLESQTKRPLAQQMRPIVDRALADAGATKALAGLGSSAGTLPFLGTALDLDLTGHVVAYAEKAFYGYLGQEEKSIRRNPAARTTDLLKSVFGK